MVAVVNRESVIIRCHVEEHGSWMSEQLPQPCARLLLEPGMFSAAEFSLENVAS